MIRRSRKRGTGHLEIGFRQVRPLLAVRLAVGRVPSWLRESQGPPVRSSSFFPEQGAFAPHRCKFTVSYIPICGEKEYYLACACGEVYTPPSAYVALYGLTVQASFLGGVLEKVGVEPQIQRIGKYKSAGDQLARKSMSKENCEMLTSLLDDIYGNWLEIISSTQGKTKEEVEEFINSGVYQVERLKENGWITNTLYDDEITSNNCTIEVRMSGNGLAGLRALDDDLEELRALNEGLAKVRVFNDGLAKMRASSERLAERRASGSRWWSGGTPAELRRWSGETPAVVEEARKQERSPISLFFP
ncbi:protease IV [Dendrobium catenatum]|uniref:Protease IV n=1 Tax=Dendrobium catenatum TaxID=906689 RepID=A0A2I0XC40_9ASPA|nr:protease IV [Dendrobium catenatum]